MFEYIEWCTQKDSTFFFLNLPGYFQLKFHIPSGASEVNSEEGFSGSKEYESKNNRLVFFKSVYEQ